MAGISTVVVDDREPAEFPILFAEAGADKVAVERLTVGDFIVNGRWVFERKTMADFCVSLIDGRLFRQSINMLKISSLPVMILQGSSREIGQYGVTREAMLGALITISVFLSIPVLRADTVAEVVKLVQYTVGQDGKFNAQTAQRHGYRPKRRRNRQLYLLQGLPGIGSRKAENLLAHFGSIRNMVNADEADLALVEGIGRKLAQRIREILD